MKSAPTLRLRSAFFLAALPLAHVHAADVAAENAGATIWRIESATSIGGHATTVLGAPLVATGAQGNSITFDGIDDGVVVPVNPLAGWKEFTIEVLFNPAAGGEREQRFLHFEDKAGSRGLMEIRLTPEGQWALDTFLLSGEHRLALLDTAKLHPAGKWTWVALRYDGRHMTHFINGDKELEGDVAFAPMVAGQISLGVRLNKVYWFKGGIREVRFHPRALADSALQRKP